MKDRNACRKIRLRSAAARRALAGRLHNPAIHRYERGLA
jgi:hypothetical protein